MSIESRIPDPEILKANEVRAAEQLRTLGFTAKNGITLKSLKPGSCTCEMEIREDHLNTLGQVHGGILYALCDTAASLAAASYGEGGNTVKGDISYLRAVRGSRMSCTAKVVKYGRHLVFSGTELFDEQGKLCCTGEFIHYQMPQAPGEGNFGIEPVFGDA